MLCGDDAGTAVQCVMELYLVLVAGVDLIGVFLMLARNVQCVNMRLIFSDFYGRR